MSDQHLQESGTPSPGRSLSVTGSHWCRGWKAYRADDTPVGTVPGRIVLVTHWEAIHG